MRRCKGPLTPLMTKRWTCLFGISFLVGIIWPISHSIVIQSYSHTVILSYWYCILTVYCIDIDTIHPLAESRHGFFGDRGRDAWVGIRRHGHFGASFAWQSLGWWRNHIRKWLLWNRFTAMGTISIGGGIAGVECRSCQYSARLGYTVLLYVNVYETF